ncbi:hypothetical protein EWB00_007528, partial [Schistosoma japonicum]
SALKMSHLTLPHGFPSPAVWQLSLGLCGHALRSLRPTLIYLLFQTLESRSIDVCCVSETRIQDPSKIINLISPYQNKETARFTLRVSGSPDAASHGLAGVGMALRQKSSCDNHRGISLTNIVSKLLASIILRRLTRAREEQTRENQAGFRPGRGCIDHIFTLRQVLEHRHTFRRPTIVVFLDLK